MINDTIKKSIINNELKVKGYKKFNKLSQLKKNDAIITFKEKALEDVFTKFEEALRDLSTKYNATIDSNFNQRRFYEFPLSEKLNKYAFYYECPWTTITNQEDIWYMHREFEESGMTAEDLEEFDNIMDELKLDMYVNLYINNKDAWVELRYYRDNTPVTDKRFLKYVNLYYSKYEKLAIELDIIMDKIVADGLNRNAEDELQKMYLFDKYGHAIEIDYMIENFSNLNYYKIRERKLV